jgi:hypothetical protein
MSVGVNPPKTPVTKGSNGVASATLPNICKMPGPPAPFVPAPLPNIGKSGDSPKGYTKKVLVENNPVAIGGATFGSMGDMASKGTGGGMVSANTHGPCKFIGPGSMDVKFEGKNVQLLSDPVTNNGAGSGTPANAATMLGVGQASAAGGDPPGSECAKIAAKIDELVNRERPEGENPPGTKGLKFRFAEQITGSMPPGTPGWNNHHDNIVQQQQALNREIAKHDAQKPPCKTPLPAGTRSWGARRPPSPIDYKQHGPAPGTQMQFGGPF